MSGQERFSESVQRHQIKDLQCDIKTCQMGRYSVGRLCLRHRQIYRRQGHPTIIVPSLKLRKTMVTLVRAELLQLDRGQDLVANVFAHADMLLRKLEFWTDSMDHHLSRLAADKMSRMEPIDFVATVIGWLIYERENRTPASFRENLPGYWTVKRHRRYEAVSLAFWLRQSANTRGSANSTTAAKSRWAKTVKLLLAWRTPRTLMSAMSPLARSIEPRITEAFADASRAISEKRKVEAERMAHELVPFEINADGTRDIFRSPEYQSPASITTERQPGDLRSTTRRRGSSR